jgi:hypothetical protein
MREARSPLLFLGCTLALYGILVPGSTMPVVLSFLSYAALLLGGAWLGGRLGTVEAELRTRRSGGGAGDPHESAGRPVGPGVMLAGIGMLLLAGLVLLVLQVLLAPDPRSLPEIRRAPHSRWLVPVLLIAATLLLASRRGALRPGSREGAPTRAYSTGFLSLAVSLFLLFLPVTLATGMPTDPGTFEHPLMFGWACLVGLGGVGFEVWTGRRRGRSSG